MISVLVVMMITFYTLSIDVKAAQNTIMYTEMKSTLIKEMQERMELKQDIWPSEEKMLSEEELKRVEQEYMNLEIEIPEINNESNDYEQEEQQVVAESVLANITTYASASSTGVFYSGGTATSTSLTYTMVKALNSSYSITTNSVLSKYTFGDKLTDSFIMPGMKTTNVKGANCTDMVPQGIAYAQGYLFVSAYCHGKKHNSVLYVIDASTKEYVTTLVLVDMPHAGGIAYTNDCLWVCNGYEKGKANAIIYYYNIKDIVNVVQIAKNSSTYNSVSLSNIEYGKVYLENQSTSSFMTAHNGYLYVGEYCEEGNGTLGCYAATARNGIYLSATSTLEVPSITQGIVHYISGSYVYMMLTSSSGFTNNSNAYLYRGRIGDKGLSYYRKIEMPSMVEQAMVYGGKTYFVFESCSKYWGTYKIALTSGILNPCDIVGKVCGFNNSFIFK